MTPTDPNERARELKPCPCGHAARIYDVSGVVEPRGKKVVSCDDPECHWSMTGYGDEQVAERWNRRALSHAAAVDLADGSCPVRELAELEDAVRHAGMDICERADSAGPYPLALVWTDSGNTLVTPPPAPAAVAGGEDEHALLAYCRRQMKAVADYLQPNWSNDMEWADEIIIAIDQRTLAAQPAAGDEVPVKCPWDEGSPCLKPRPVGMVYPQLPDPRAFGYLDKTGVEWAAFDTGQMEHYGRLSYSDGWEAGYAVAAAQRPGAGDVRLEQAARIIEGLTAMLFHAAVMGTDCTIHGRRMADIIGDLRAAESADEIEALISQPSGGESQP